ncbi:putative glutathione transferase [Arabidopsis thaliana]|uniref:Myb-like domain-containing protein n=1 Tax=Arabidopsis thaliana TaxID=3702 RepID=Q5BPY4_ARATH|nr:hypothetical protein At1g37080 [Arabidopsis thaliana]
MNPFPNQANFIDLLTSQHETPNRQPNPYETHSPSIKLGESEFLVFNTQWHESHLQGGNTTTKRTTTTRNKWTSKEDIVLISTWLNTSKDSVVGNEQRADAFWKRVVVYFASTLNVSSQIKREPSHSKQRWGKINKIVCMFGGSHEAANTQMASGMNEDVLMKLANEIYEND